MRIQCTTQLARGLRINFRGGCLTIFFTLMFYMVVAEILLVIFAVEVAIVSLVTLFEVIDRYRTAKAPKVRAAPPVAAVAPVAPAEPQDAIPEDVQPFQW